MSGSVISLRDALRVLVTQWPLIVLTTVIGLGIAYAASDAESRTYRASAEVRLRETSEDVTVVRGAAGPSLTVAELAERTKDLVNQPVVRAPLARVARGRMSPQQVRKALLVRADPETGLVRLRVTAHDPALVATLANTWARSARDTASRESRSYYRLRALALRRRLASIRERTGRRALQQQISGLDSVSLVAQPVSLARLAEVPSRAISPRVGLSSVLGGGLGLLLGVLLAGARYLADPRFRGLADVEPCIGLPLLARTAQSSGHARLGASALEPMRMLRHYLNDVGGPSSVLVTSPVIDEDKSTVAVDLARVLAEGGARTALIECDLRRPRLAAQLRLHPSPGLSDVLTGETVSADVFQEDSSTTLHGVGCLRCVVGGMASLRSAEMLAGSRMTQFIADIVATHDVVVLDSCPLLPVADTLGLLPSVDYVLLCVDAGGTSREETLRAREILARRPRLEAGLVLTGSWRWSAA